MAVITAAHSTTSISVANAPKSLVIKHLEQRL